MSSKAHTIEDVVARGMCVGCGGCSVASGGRIPIRFTSIGLRQADLEGVHPADIAIADRVCPMSDSALNEDELGAPSDWGNQLPLDAKVGHYSLVAAGRREDEEALMESSSGGLTSWLLEELLEHGHIDGVIHSTTTPNSSDLFGFNVSRTAAELQSRKKSKYYGSTIADALAEIRGDGKRYALVGIPCVIKAARLLAHEDEQLREQLAFYAGLVCGHLKTRYFAESLGWQLGVPPEALETVDFRLKNSSRVASRYDMSATSRGPESETHRGEVASLIGGNWGHAVFQPEGCNFCDDIFAETADIVFGDAWLPEYTRDWRGMNVVVSRNRIADSLLASGVARGEIRLDELTPDRASTSQAGNFRHRRDGLAVRSYDDLKKGLSVPRKRVAPSLEGVSMRRRKVIRQRRKISALSFGLFVEAKRRGDLSYYTDRIVPELERHDKISRGGIGARVLVLKNRIARILRAAGLKK